MIETMKKILSLAVLIMVSIAAQAQQIDLMQAVPNDSLVRTGTLDSGIKYYIRANKKDPKRANFHIVYNVGAIQEADNQNGLAHFLEHMAFNGSKNFHGNAMIDYLQSIGVRFGENLNAGTGQEMTTYMITN
ncbi:MAG: insulinase family protein, partial [Mucinivorans sp.]